MCGSRCGSIVAVMTDTITTGPRPLYRDPADQKFAGVCAAVARFTDTDPVIWRIVVVVLALFGGSGVVLYLLGWLLIPKLGEDGSAAESWLSRRGHTTTPKTLAIIGLLGAVLLVGMDDGNGVGVIAVLLLLIYLVRRERKTNPVTYAAPADAVAWTPPPPVVRERSALGLATLSAATLLAGILSWASLSGVDTLTVGRIVAAALVVVGAGLVIGTWYGRARWLIAVGILLSLALGGIALADRGDVTLRGGAGQRTWVVGEHSDRFRLGVGEATLDLRQVRPGSHVTAAGSVSLGHLIVIVPDGVAVRVHAKVRVGEIAAFGKSVADGSDGVSRDLVFGPPGDPQIEVDANVGTGQVEVRHG
jgi:phage shock protein PspC (stress-responsive transcriptional regulator)